MMILWSAVLLLLFVATLNGGHVHVEALAECRAEGADNCACRYDGGGGLVNIRSLNQPKSPIIVRGGTPNITVTFNPCTGIDVGPVTSPCRNVTVCVELDGIYRDFGVPSKSGFADISGRLSLAYQPADESAATIIELVCDESQRHTPKVTLLAEEFPLILAMELRSVCACPGGCLNPPISCDRVDDCSCRLSDGSGTLSLHNLDNPFAPLSAKAVDHWNTSYTYYYNPCSPFSLPAPVQNCTNVAACQTIPQNSEDFNIGVHSNVTYRVSTVDSQSVVLHYIHGNDGRNSYVQLICNAAQESPVFTFIKEDPFRTYHFTLESRDCCTTRQGNVERDIAKLSRL
eukprot:scpid86713/ scgid24427/ 